MCTYIHIVVWRTHCHLTHTLFVTNHIVCHESLGTRLFVTNHLAHAQRMCASDDLPHCLCVCQGIRVCKMMIYNILYMYTYIDIVTWLYTYTYIQIYTCVHVFTYTSVFMHVAIHHTACHYTPHTQTEDVVCPHNTYIYIYLHIYTCVHVYTYTWVFMHVAIHHTVCMSRYTTYTDGGCGVPSRVHIHVYLYIYVYIYIHV